MQRLIGLLNTSILASIAAIGLAQRPLQASPPQPRQPVTVLMVNDGQEVLVDALGQGRSIRLSCLQAPRPQQQPWADQASASLKDLLPAGSEWIFELRSRDVHGRLVGRLLERQSDGTPGRDVAESLIKQGKVFVFDGSLGRCDDLPYEAWEAEARQHQQGVWQSTGGLQRPWDVLETQRSGTLAP